MRQAQSSRWRLGRHQRSGARLCAISVAVLLRACSELGASTGFAGPPSQLRRGGKLDRWSSVALRAGSSTEDLVTAEPDAASTFAPSRSGPVQAWGTFGVCAYLSFGIVKVVPIVLDGIGAIEAPWQWALLAATLLFFAYVEGYRGFQLGFSPRVVSRAWVVSEESADAPFWHKILAPAFCIGYFHGTTKRVVTSWGVTAVIFAVVIGVKQLANPYRAIIDAGVIVGLVWGIVSIIFLFANSLQKNEPPDFDPSLPEDTPYTAPLL